MASKRAVRRRRCAGKQRLPDEATARAVAGKLTRRQAWPVTPYRCPFCGHFHVGHAPGHGR